jgi:SNF2 family DNA or RNA helicase
MQAPLKIERLVQRALPKALFSVNAQIIRDLEFKYTSGKSGLKVTIVVTTPELFIIKAKDANELTKIDWEILIVDEAHRYYADADFVWSK